MTTRTTPPVALPPPPRATTQPQARYPRRRPLPWLLAGLLATGGVTAAEPAAQPATLETITVTATLSKHDTRLAPASVSIVDRAELDKLNPQNLLQAVRAVPGVSLSPRQVGGRKTLSLRGMEGRHVLTLIDGRRIVATDDVVGHSDYQYGWLPMAAVERIEVIRGPMSTLYGSEALGGVINLITCTPGRDWQGEVSLNDASTQGNAGRHAGAASVYAAGPLGRHASLRISGNRGYAPAVANVDDPRYSELEGSRVNAGTLGLTFDLAPQQALEFNHVRGLEKRLYDDVSRSNVAYTNRYAIHRRQTDLAWRGTFAGWHAQARAYKGRTDITNQRSHGVAATRPQSLADQVLDGHVVSSRGPQTWTLGGELRRETLINAGLTGGRDAARHRALFAQDEVGLGERLKLTAGLRYDQHELFGHELSPRAYLVWQASPAWVIKGGYGHAFKAPTLKQISPNYVGAEGPHTFLGNAAIRPETLDSFELSADWRHGNFDVVLGAFRSNVKDLITYRLLSVQGPRHIYQYDNVDAARIAGIEAGLGWQLAKNWHWQTSLSFLDTEDRNTGTDLEYRPRTNATSQLDWSGGDGWTARLGVQRIGVQHSAAGELPAYALWNLRVGKYLGSSIEVQLAAENLTNLRLADQSPLFGYVERGRTLSVNVRSWF